MSNRVSSISIRTTLKFEENKDILFALRNVLDVVDADFGYIVILEEPVKAEQAEPTIKAITSFDFVEDVANVTAHDFQRDHAVAEAEVNKWIFDAITAKTPTLKSLDNDIGRFSAYRRAWVTAQRKIYDALYGK
jgi:hypothetical protein